MRKDTRKRFLGVPFVLIMVFIQMPLWILVSGSFMEGAELSENPTPILKGRRGAAAWPVIVCYPTLAAYVGLLLDMPQFFAILWNSCRRVFPIIPGYAPLGAPAAWAFAEFHFRGKKILYTLHIILMLMPFQVTMVSSYLILDKMGLIDTTRAVILFGAASTLPAFIVTRFFMDIPAAVMEAAAVDGAPSLQTFLRFGFPLGAPGILSAVVLGFLEHRDAIKTSQIFLKDQALWPLPLCMPNITADNAGVSLIASLITLTSPPPIFLSGQKYLEQGIISSGMED